MKKIGLYIRVSTDEQAEVEEGSLKNQEDSLRKWVLGENTKHNNKWGAVVDIYVDDGYSAKNLSRPQITRLLRDVAKKRVDTVLMTEISRLSRNVRDWIDLREFFQENGATFISTRQNFDTSTAMGRAMLSFAIEFAQLERELTAERTKASYHARAARGLWTGGPLPFGLDKTNAAGHPQVNVAKQVIANEILDILVNKAGKAKDAVEMITEAGYTRDGGLPWDDKALCRWVRQRALIGEKELNPENEKKDQSILPEQERYKIEPAVWGPIVDRDLWLKANELLDRNYQANKVEQWLYHDFILTGLLECPHGGRLVGSSGWGKSGDKYPHYKHSPTKNPNCKCHIKTIKAPEIEDAVIDELKRVIKTPEVLKELAKRANEDFKKERPNYRQSRLSILGQIESSKKATDTIADTLLQIKQDRGLDEGRKQMLNRTWEEKLEKIDRERRGLEAELRAVEECLSSEKVEELDTNAIHEAVQVFIEKYDDLPIAAKQSLLTSVLEKVEIRKDEIVLHVKNPGFSIGGGFGGGAKSKITEGVTSRDSGLQRLAHCQIWGDRPVHNHSAHLRLILSYCRKSICVRQ